MLASAGVGLCVALAAAELADVYLRSGLRLRGDVRVTETVVVVRNELGETRIPREQVERIVPVTSTPPAPATQPGVPADTRPTTPAETQPATRAVPDAGAEPVIGGPARPVLPAPPLVSALDIQRLKLSELRLDGEPEKVRVRFAGRDQQELPRQLLRELSARPDFRPEWEATLLRGQPHEKLQVIAAATGAAHADGITIGSDPQVFATFRAHVLPLVVRGCARAGCHAGEEAVALRLPDGSTRSEAYAYTTFALLDRLRLADGSPLIDRDDPEGSALLAYMVPEGEDARSHPPVVGKRRFTPVLRSRENPVYGRVRDWINSLRAPRPDYGLDYEFPAPVSTQEAAPAGPASAPAGGAERERGDNGTTPTSRPRQPTPRP